MANSKSNTVTVPLNGNLCLSKKQLDISQFTGWDKVNGPIYGECLSPLYKSTESTVHDYWDSDGNYYDVYHNGTTVLEKNSSVVMSTTSSNRFKKEEITPTWDCIDKDTGNYICIKKINGNTYGYTSSGTVQNYVDKTGTVSGTIIRVKARAKGSAYMYAVLYVNGSSYYLQLDGGTVKLSIDPDEMVNPEIQIGFVGSSNYPVVSVYSNWGNNVTSMKTETFIYYSGSWVSVSKFVHASNDSVDEKHYYKVPKTLTVSASVSATETWKMSYEYGGEYKSYVTKTTGYGIEQEYLTFRLSDLPTDFTTSNTKLYMHYFDSTGTDTKIDLTASNTELSTTFIGWTGDSDSGYTILIREGNRITTSIPLYWYSLQSVTDSSGTTTLTPSTEWPEDDHGQLFDPSTSYLTLEQGETIYTIPASSINYSYNYSGSGGNFDHLSTTTNVPGDYSLVTYEEKEELPTIIKDVDGIMDDGSFYAVTPVSSDIINSDGSIPRGTVVLKGSYNDFSGTVLTYNVADYVIFYYSDSTVTDATGIPKYYKGYSVSLGQRYLRNCYSFTTTNEDDADMLYLMYDNVINKLLFQPGVTAGTCVNGQGSRYSHINGTGFNLLYNENSPSGISYSDEEDQIGTLVSDWARIDPSFDVCAYTDSMDYEYCIYKDTDGTYWKITVSPAVTDDNYWKVLEQRFFILNTTDYLNCYDMQTGKKYHFASDWNNRILTGTLLSSGFVDNNGISHYSSDNKDVILFASGQNVNYEMKNNFPICSVTFPMHIYQYASTTNFFPVAISQPSAALEQVDVYLTNGADSTVATYFKSYSGSNTYRDGALTDAYYPDDLAYNLNMFSDIIETYTNTDMVLAENTAYTLRYSGITPIFASAYSSGLDGITDAFVLQTMHYAISNQYLVALDYDEDGTISRTETVTDITGMQYLGCLPKQALFYSPMNRSIYSFTGDAIMTEMAQANKITEISGTWYNPSTQAIYIQTNAGLYIMADNFTYCLENITGVKNIYFMKKGTAKIVTGSSTITIAYNTFDNSTSIPLSLETKYYGLGDNKKCSVTGWYLRFYNNEDTTATGTIKLKCRTITDIGTTTDETTITVAATNWDTATNSYYLKYTPKYSSSVGTQLCIESSFPIISISCAYVPEDTVALSHTNA